VFLQPLQEFIPLAAGLARKLFQLLQELLVELPEKVRCPIRHDQSKIEIQKSKMDSVS
jgi:hypothetical protein